MKGIKVIRDNNAIIVLQPLIDKLQSSISSKVIDEIYGGVTFGSFAKETNSVESDVDALIFHCIPLRDLILINRAKESYKDPIDGVIVENNPAYTVYIIDSVKYEIGHLPLTNTRGREGLMELAANNKVHDLLNLIYGIPLKLGRYYQWIFDFRQTLLDKFNWPEKEIIDHGAGMGLSQIKKAEAKFKKGDLDVLRYLKLLTTSFYIAMNSYHLITKKTWFGSYFDCVVNSADTKVNKDEKEIELLDSTMKDFYLDMGQALKQRGDYLKRFTLPALEKALPVLDSVADLLTNVPHKDFITTEREENIKLINSFIEKLYNMETTKC